MNPSELFERWAPSDGAWSDWAKPVLFASGVADDAAKTAWLEARQRAHGRFVPPRPGETALVLDLPGADSLAIALDCAAAGYRPVPLYNSTMGPNPVVPNEPIRAGLELGVDELANARLRSDAAPAFVLDARRIKGDPKPKSFDNQWVVFPQDFPSAAVLGSRGIRRVVLVQDGRTDPQNDLAHVLVRWQNAGVGVASIDLASSSQAPVEVRIATPELSRALFQRVLRLVGLRRNSAGGFGSEVPEQATGGTGFA